MMNGILTMCLPINSSVRFPFFLIIILILLTAGCWTSDPDVYLIPEGYIGPVVVAFEQEDGEPVRRSGDTLVYRIPPDGVLRTQAPFPDGYHHIFYYYVDAQGRRSPLPMHSPIEEVPESETQVFGVISGYLGELAEQAADTLIVYGAWETDIRSPSVRFLVGKRSDYARLAAQRDSVEDAITRPVRILPRP